MAIDLNSVTFDKRITPDSILDRVSDLDIYRYYIGDDAVSLRPINSPLRRDNIPSFLFSTLETKAGICLKISAVELVVTVLG